MRNHLTDLVSTSVSTEQNNLTPFHKLGNVSYSFREVLSCGGLGSAMDI